MLTEPKTLLLARADARWALVLAARPDLGPAVSLQRSLVAKLIDAAGALTSSPGTVPALDPATLLEKLNAGIPAFHGASFSIPPVLSGSLLIDICTCLAEGGAGTAAIHIREALERRRFSGSSLLAGSLLRNQHAIRMGADQMGVSADLLWLIGELAVGPLANQLQRSILGEPGEGFITTVAGAADWNLGYCPACGSWPALAEVCGSARLLRCSFCGAGWWSDSFHCTYCDAAGPAFNTDPPRGARPGRWLELCDACGAYLKGIAVSERTEFVLLPIEDLATTDLDVRAVERGYGRPPLKDFGAVTAQPCAEESSPPGKGDGDHID